MAANTTLNVTDLDFTSIKSNLKTFLKSQSEFQDYDFEGSGMSVLLDLLAYNTYYNAFYLNMAANEAFLDSAQIRKNILSLAKVIKYIPKSKQGSTAILNVTITPTITEPQDKNIVTMDKYLRLIGGDLNGVNYPFITLNEDTVSKSDGKFHFANVYVRQGEVVTHQFEMMSNNSTRSFIIPSANVDTSTVTVTVQESASNTHTQEYFLATDITEIKANSKVFFLEENYNLNYTIQFGDNVLGQRPANGNIIIVSYLDVASAPANDIRQFKFADPIGGEFDGYTSNVKIDIVSPSLGGVEKETEDQIKFRAPYAYTAQNRAVTRNDYESIITNDFNNIDAVSVWGGEDNDPVVYGKVYLSLKTKNYYKLSELEKKNIVDNLIRNRNVMTVIPEIIEPEYVFVLSKVKVSYNVNITTKTQNQLKTAVRNAIIQYSNEELNTFRSTFRKSKLQQYIENADPAITGSDVTIFLQKQVELYPNEIKNYNIPFNARLMKAGIDDKLYTFPETTVYDSNGNERLAYFEEVPVSYTGINSIEVTNSGSGYVTAPIVTITGDGHGAKAEAKIVNGKVKEIVIIDKGYEYTKASVTLTSSDGFGAGATATATLSRNLGTLRTYYYSANGEKTIVNSYAGDINYERGLISLNALEALNTIPNDFYANNVLTINCVPEDEIIQPLRNRIITLDSNDVKSIVIELVPET